MMSDIDKEEHCAVNHFRIFDGVAGWENEFSYDSRYIIEVSGSLYMKKASTVEMKKNGCSLYKKRL